MRALNFSGDRRADLIGRVLGPDTAGGRYVVTDAVLTDTGTRASTRPLLPAEHSAVTTDESGQLWLTESGG